MKIKIVLNLRGRSNAQLVADAERYTTLMTGNPNYASAEIVVQVTVTKTAAIALRTGMSAPASDSKSDVVRIARKTLEWHLTKLVSKVEGLANDPALGDINRENLVHSAGMIVKTQGSPQKHVFAAKNGSVSGSVIHTAQGGAKAHEWKYTSDIVNFTEKVSLDTTPIAKTEITGLEPVTEYAFFHKAILTGGKTDWEELIFLVVV